MSDGSATVSFVLELLMDFRHDFLSSNLARWGLGLGNLYVVFEELSIEENKAFLFAFLLVLDLFLFFLLLTYFDILCVPSSPDYFLPAGLSCRGCGAAAH